MQYIYSISSQISTLRLCGQKAGLILSAPLSRLRRARAGPKSKDQDEAGLFRGAQKDGNAMHPWSEAERVPYFKKKPADDCGL